MIFAWFAFRNNQSNLTTVSNICKNIYFLLCAVLNFKQRIAEKILNNLCGTSFINGLVGMPYKEKRQVSIQAAIREGVHKKKNKKKPLGTPSSIRLPVRPAPKI